MTKSSSARGYTHGSYIFRRTHQRL